MVTKKERGSFYGVIALLTNKTAAKIYRRLKIGCHKPGYFKPLSRKHVLFETFIHITAERRRLSM